MSLLQVLCPPQADGTSSSRLQAWLDCSQLPWLLQAAGALLAHAEGRSEATELQVGGGCCPLLSAISVSLSPCCGAFPSQDNRLVGVCSDSA